MGDATLLPSSALHQQQCPSTRKLVSSAPKSSTSQTDSLLMKRSSTSCASDALTATMHSNWVTMPHWKGSITASHTSNSSLHWRATIPKDSDTRNTLQSGLQTPRDLEVSQHNQLKPVETRPLLATQQLTEDPFGITLFELELVELVDGFLMVERLFAL